MRLVEFSIKIYNIKRNSKLLFQEDRRMNDSLIIRIIPNDIDANIYYGTKSAGNSTKLNKGHIWCGSPLLMCIF